VSLVFQMAKLSQTSFGAAYKRDLERLRDAFQEPKSAGSEPERLVSRLAGAEQGSAFPASRLSQPVLQSPDVRVLPDGGRQARAFTKRLNHTAA
jgi:hypothetical protein